MLYINEEGIYRALRNITLRLLFQKLVWNIFKVFSTSVEIICLFYDELNWLISEF